MSRFSLQAIDLGVLKEVHVEHNRQGYGAGWYLDKITIQVPEKHDGCYVFSCQQWLDSGVGDGKIKRELQLLGKVRKERLSESVHGKMQNPQETFKLLFQYILSLSLLGGSTETKNTFQI